MARFVITGAGPEQCGCGRCAATIAKLRAEVDKLGHLAELQDKISREVRTGWGYLQLSIYVHSTVVWISSIYCVRLQNAALYSISPWSLAIRRVPALLLTMSLELVGGVVIDQLHKVASVGSVEVTVTSPCPGYPGLHPHRQLHAGHLRAVRQPGAAGQRQHHPRPRHRWAAAAVQPAACSPQSAAGQIPPSSYLANMWKEIKSGLLSATLIAATICTIGTVWAYADSDNVDINKT